MKEKNERKVYLVFFYSVVLKGLNAIGEIVGGIVALIISQEFIIRTALYLTQNELSEDPSDKFANYLIHSAQQFSVSSKHFIAIYLLSHGLIKLGLVIGLLKNKTWAYPVSIFVFALFILYQIYRFYFTHSIWLIALTIFDLIVVWLVWHEYNRLFSKKIVDKNALVN
jgi:uncharacterized membrane protein